jgi:hypothetical protein
MIEEVARDLDGHDDRLEARFRVHAFVFVRWRFVLWRKVDFVLLVVLTDGKGVPGREEKTGHIN